MPFIRREKEKHKSKTQQKKQKCKSPDKTGNLLGPQNAPNPVEIRCSSRFYLFFLLLIIVMSVLCYELITVKMGGMYFIRKALQTLRYVKNRKTSRGQMPTEEGVSVTNETYMYGFSFTPTEILNVKKCVRTYAKVRQDELSKTRRYWKERWTSHRHVTSRSTVIEFGGHRGNDFKGIYDMYQPKKYVVLEPVPQFYDILVKKYGNISGTLFYNFGVGSKTENVTVGRISDGTSIFRQDSSRTSTQTSLKIFAVGKVFEIIDLKNSVVDLLTMNCEGCEYAVLQYLFQNPKWLKQFLSIQFQPHFNIKKFDPLLRYCQYQELLSRTHQIVYQHKFWWEAWRLQQ